MSYIIRLFLYFVIVYHFYHPLEFFGFCRTKKVAADLGTVFMDATQIIFEIYATAVGVFV